MSFVAGLGRQDQLSEVREAYVWARVIAALKVLQDAVVYCKTRDIDTPEILEALDILGAHCSAKREIKEFRNNLRPVKVKNRRDVDGQQRRLRVHFSGIYTSVRQLLEGRILRLAAQYRHSQEVVVRDDLCRLTAELPKVSMRAESSETPLR